MLPAAVGFPECDLHFHVLKNAFVHNPCLLVCVTFVSIVTNPWLAKRGVYTASSVFSRPPLPGPFSLLDLRWM